MSTAEPRFTESAEELVSVLQDEYATHVRERAIAVANKQGEPEVTVEIVRCLDVDRPYIELRLDSVNIRSRMFRLIASIVWIIGGALGGALIAAVVFNQAHGSVNAWMSDRIGLIGATAAFVVATVAVLVAGIYNVLDLRLSHTSPDLTARFIDEWRQLEGAMASQLESTTVTRLSDASGAELIRMAEGRNWLTESDAGIARRLFRLRNDIVHRGRVLTAGRARSAVEQVRDLSKALAASLGS